MSERDYAGDVYTGYSNVDENHEVTLSIITPAHNPDLRLAEACESVAQAIAILKEKKYEILVEQIICDDKSPALEVDTIYSCLEERFSFVRCIKNTARYSGPAAARNHAMQYAKGNWIGFLDADDHLVPEGLVRLIDVASRNPRSEWIVGDIVVFYPDGQEVLIRSRFRTFGATGYEEPIEICGPTAMRVHAGFPDFYLGAMIAKKRLIEQAGNFNVDFVRSEDWYLLLSMTIFSGVIYVPTAVLRLRRGTVSLTQSNNVGELDGVRATWKAIREQRFCSVRHVLRWTLISQLSYLRDVNFARHSRRRAFQYGVLCAIAAPENPRYWVAAFGCLVKRAPQPTKV